MVGLGFGFYERDAALGEGSLLQALHSSRCKNNCFAVMRSSSEEGSCLRLLDVFITQ